MIFSEENLEYTTYISIHIYVYVYIDIDTHTHAFGFPRWLSGKEST